MQPPDSLAISGDKAGRYESRGHSFMLRWERWLCSPGRQPHLLAHTSRRAAGVVCATRPVLLIPLSLPPWLPPKLPTALPTSALGCLPLC